MPWNNWGFWVEFGILGLMVIIMVAGGLYYLGCGILWILSKLRRKKIE